MRATTKMLFFVLGLAMTSSAVAGQVTRAMFTIGVQDREPVLSVDSINSGAYNSISFFTELNEMSGHNVTHQWTFNDEVMFEKTFEVKGPRWRVWTSKTLIPDWTGSWTVNVLDDNRAVLQTRSFEYQ